MSPFFSEEEVRYNHLRREPITKTRFGKKLAYLDEKCPNGGGKTCPNGDACDKCHNEKEYMYHPLVYMTTECRNHRNHKCANRTCAFYHSEAQHLEAKENRENLLEEIAETERKEREQSSQSSDSPLAVDLNSDNQFPSLPEVDLSKEKKKKPRSYAETAKAAVRAPSSTSSQENNGDEDQNTNPLLSSLNKESQVYSPPSGPITSPPFAAQMTAPSPTFTPSNSPFAPSLGADFFPGNGTHPFSLGAGSFFDGPQAGTGSIFPSYIWKDPFSTFPADPSEEINELLKLNRTKPMNYQRNMYEGIWLECGEEHRVVVKEIELIHLTRDEVLHNLSRLKALHHPNILPIRSIVRMNDRVYVVKNYYDQSHSLASFLTRSREKLIDTSTGDITPLCTRLIVQICSVVQYLHKHQIPYRNLELSNIFIEEKLDEHHQIFVTDFGVSTNGMVDLYNNSNVWIAPEESQPMRAGAEPKGDIWRLGVIIYFILSGTELDSKTMLNNPIMDKLPYYRSLLSLLLHGDPNQRLSGPKIMDHPVFWIHAPSRILRFVTNSLKIKFTPPLDQLCGAQSVEWFGRSSWKEQMPAEICKIIPNFDTLDGTSVSALLRSIIVTFNQLQRTQENESKQMQQLKESIRRRFHSAGHPILFFHDLYPNLVLRLWAAIHSHHQTYQAKLAQYEKILCF